MSNQIHKRVIKDTNDARVNLMNDFGIYIAPEENNVYNVHFVIPGENDSPYKGGLYHGMIRLNTEHPFKPPSIYMITPNGRFISEKYPLKGSQGICVDGLTAYHPGSWTATQTIVNLMTAFVSFMLDEDPGKHIGWNLLSVAERKKMAIESLKYIQNDDMVRELFPDLWKSVVDGTYKPKSLGNNNTSAKKVDEEKIKKKPVCKIKEESESNDSSSSEDIEEEMPKKLVKKPSKKTTRRNEIVSESEESSEEIPKKLVKKPSKKTTRPDAKK